jgi:hypothetical protein
MLAACSSGLRPLRGEVAASEANSAVVATTLVLEGELTQARFECLPARLASCTAVAPMVVGGVVPWHLGSLLRLIEHFTDG